MSVLVYAESPKGRFKKAALEAVHYGHLTAQAVGGSCTALVLGQCEDPGSLGSYGATKVIHISESSLDQFDSGVVSSIIAEVAGKIGANTVVVAHSSTGKSITGRLSVKMNAGVVSGVNSIPSTDGGFKVKKNVFAGKAIAEVQINTENRVISLMGNAIPPAIVGSAVAAEGMDVSIPQAGVTVVERKTVDGTVPLPEAELVVSAGRGMKGPEHWGIIEDLATLLGATTACSRPVADTGWRPHHEHVGQTGVDCCDQ